MIKFKKLDPCALIPRRATEGSAGFDIYAWGGGGIERDQQEIIETRIACQLPKGFCFQIWPRSGLAVESGIHVMAGLIDSDYTGEIKVCLRNMGREIFWYSSKDRIAQLVPVKIDVDLAVSEVDDLFESGRGDGGFGHTGR